MREWPLQQMVWADGIRLDIRCLFGTATMVALFERVSHFVLSVAKKIIACYDSQHPYSPARRAWQRWRSDNIDTELPHWEIEQACSPSYIYLDDAHGATVNDMVYTIKKGQQILSSSIQVHYDGRIRLYILPTTNRPRAHLLLTTAAFNEAGWKVAEEKVQLGSKLDLLGYTLDAESERVWVPDVKRRGLLRDIDAQLQTNGAHTIKHNPINQ